MAKAGKIRLRTKQGQELWESNLGYLLRKYGTGWVYYQLSRFMGEIKLTDAGKARVARNRKVHIHLRELCGWDK
jgi:hypothetical protein